jgi:hypothetical protein
MKPKIHLRPGAKLSEIYASDKNHFKVVETDHPIAYVVSGGGKAAAATVYPLYRADVHLKIGKTWHIVSSYEQGERLNDFTFHADYEGCTFALIACQAINALEDRKARAPKKAPRKGKGKRA